MKKLDLIGQTFGRLTVIGEAPKTPAGNIRWNCICTCGKTTISHTTSLRSGDTLSCGCLNRELTRKARFKDLTGKTFGYFTVLERTTNSKAGRARWKCLCKCGNIVVVQGSNLPNGHAYSCGCYKREEVSQRCLDDLTDQIFGRLTVVSRASDNKSGKTRWNCKCICGKETVVHATALKSGASTSCRCLAIEQLVKRNMDRPGYISKSASFFLDRIEEAYNIKLEREYEIEHRYFDGRYNNVLLEVDGEYWHSTPDAIGRDKHKNCLAKNAGFTLVRIPVNNIKEVEPALKKYAPALDIIFNS